MSTILKALRRLEQEKARADRSLREQVTGPNGAYRGEGGPQRRWPILLGGIGAGVFAGLTVLLLVFSRGGPAEEAPEAVTSPDPPAARAQVPGHSGIPVRSRSTPGRSGLAAAQAGAQDPTPGVAEDVVVIDRGSPGPRTIAEAVPVPDPGAEPLPPKPGSLRPLHRGDPRDLPGAHLLSEGEPAATPPVPAPEAVAALAAPPTPAVAPAPVVAPAPAVASDPAVDRGPAVAPRPAVTPARETPPAPFIPAETPKPARPPAAPFPALRVERTTWHPLAERRVAVVLVPGAAAQNVHEGDVVAGARVKRIEPSGVVFEHSGREVRRKIGAGGREGRS